MAAGHDGSVASTAPGPSWSAASCRIHDHVPFSGPFPANWPVLFCPILCPILSHSVQCDSGRKAMIFNRLYRLPPVVSGPFPANWPVPFCPIPCPILSHSVQCDSGRKAMIFNRLYRLPPVVSGPFPANWPVPFCPILSYSLSYSVPFRPVARPSHRAPAGRVDRGGSSLPSPAEPAASEASQKMKHPALREPCPRHPVAP